MQRKEKQFRKRNSLALKLFCALLVFVVVPMYFTVLFVRDRYEAYFKDELSANITSTLAKSEAEIEEILAGAARGRFLGLFGEPRVNVLQVNLQTRF